MKAVFSMPVGIGYRWIFAACFALSAPGAQAEDFEKLSTTSLEYLRALVPQERGQSSPELLRWYELMQSLEERSAVIRQSAPVSSDPDDRYRIGSYSVNGAIAHDPEVQRITQEVRRLQPSIQRELLRDELMMWYAPSEYLASIRSERHRRYLVRYGWSPQTTVAQMVGRNDYVRNLQELHVYRQARLQEEGWSETFWPDFTGSLAVPYADPTLQMNFLNYLFFEMNQGFLRARSTVQQRLAQMQPRSVSLETTSRLSPAEKYDLLLGDLDFTFTTRVLQMVDQIADDGQMANWSGVCDGWSSASQNYFRPEQSVEITGARGHRIKFYPSDIKGLASFLWAKSFDRSGMNLTHGAGYQCKRNDRDAHGRLLDPTCNDINPGYFHLAAVNILGIDRHGFIFDKAHSPNVLNQPAFAYDYRYFRPDNQAETLDLERAKKRIGTFRDAFARYRSPRATHIVGVKMRVWYKKEQAQPRARDTDSVRQDRDHTVDLRYDLELDAAGNIVGGEWWFYQDIFRPNLADDLNDSHPDTLWLTVPGIRMYSTANEAAMPAWNSGEPIPAGLLPFAQAAARTMKPPFGPNDSVQHDVFRPQPLPVVVERLVELSRPSREHHQLSRVPGRYRPSFCGRWDSASQRCLGWNEAEWDYEIRTGREYPFQ